ncbi:unnamed protein product [Lepeophtheirus salmonis]|uniref:(salmon louse) hypothetical protein n=1 Tax=Lepeophtheirus salmonis TaxID=72036 RepID=A0A817FG90_LEPSM|nr:unnamed protein product [Lepeophtheirus salmonis]CAG9477864.1 unnamed protein product [Lepeophtheirus salmonis]
MSSRSSPLLQLRAALSSLCFFPYSTGPILLCSSKPFTPISPVLRVSLLRISSRCPHSLPLIASMLFHTAGPSSVAFQARPLLSRLFPVLLVVLLPSPQSQGVLRFSCADCARFLPAALSLSLPHVTVLSWHRLFFASSTSFRAAAGRPPPTDSGRAPLRITPLPLGLSPESPVHFLCASPCRFSSIWVLSFAAPGPPFLVWPPVWLEVGVPLLRASGWRLPVLVVPCLSPVLPFRIAAIICALAPLLSLFLFWGPLFFFY